MEGSIRKFRNDDAEVVSDLISANITFCFKDCYDDHVISHLIEGFSTQKILKMPKTRKIFVYVREGQIVGVVGLLKKEVKMLFVKNEFRGRGIGKILIEHIEKFAKKEGLDEVELNSSIYSEKFYYNAGYNKTGTIDLPIGNTTYKCISMVKKL